MGLRGLYLCNSSRILCLIDNDRRPSIKRWFVREESQVSLISNHHHQSISSRSLLNMQHIDLIQVLKDVLSGKQRIVSHPGTGQYQATSESASSTSACGLAALNCARIVFQYQNSTDAKTHRHPEYSCGQSENEVHDEGSCLFHCILSRRVAEVSDLF